jgi:hypothetical protein
VHRTGLLSFWGCAVLIRRGVLEDLEGYDPEILIWANELEFMLRFFDRGYRHLHMPDIVAQHMKPPPPPPETPGLTIDWRPHDFNFLHWGYIAAKFLRPRDAVSVLVALMARTMRNAVFDHPGCIRGIPAALRGFARGLRRREPLRNPEISRFYRKNLEDFAIPWWLAHPGKLILGMSREFANGTFRGGEIIDELGRREEFYDQRRRWYPKEPAALEF